MQFFNFFSDFYDKYEEGKFGAKNVFEFEDNEKEIKLK